MRKRMNRMYETARAHFPKRNLAYALLGALAISVAAGGCGNADDTGDRANVKGGNGPYTWCLPVETGETIAAIDKALDAQDSTLAHQIAAEFTDKYGFNPLISAKFAISAAYGFCTTALKLAQAPVGDPQTPGEDREKWKKMKVELVLKLEECANLCSKCIAGIEAGPAGFKEEENPAAPRMMALLRRELYYSRGMLRLYSGDIREARGDLGKSLSILPEVAGPVQRWSQETMDAIDAGKVTVPVLE